MKTSTKGILSIIVIIAAIAIGYYAIFLAVPATTVDTPVSSDLVEAAKQEGSLNLYNTGPRSFFDSLAAAFMDKYPFIDAQVVTDREATLVVKMGAENRAGNVIGDVFVTATNPLIMDVLKERGIFEAYTSDHIKLLDQQYRDSDDTYFMISSVPLVMIYNPDIMSVSEAPKSYEEMGTRTDLKGKVAWTEASVGGFPLVEYFLVREKYGVDWHKQYLELNPKLFSTHGAIAQAVVNGEVSYGSVGLVHALRFLNQGANIKIVLPEEGTPTAISVAALIADAPHPAAAKLFLNFLVSPEAQNIYDEAFGPHLLTTEAGTPQVLIDSGGPTYGEILENVWVPDWEKLAVEREDVVTEFKLVYG